MDVSRLELPRLIRKIDPAERSEIQKAYTIPVNAVKNAVLSNKARVGYGLLGAGAVAYGYATVVAGYSTMALAQATFAAMTKVAMTALEACFVAGVVTPVGMSALATSGVAAIVALAKRNLPGSFSVVTANILSTGVTLLEFYGDYGPKLNALRVKLWNAILPARVDINRRSDEDLAAEMTGKGVDASTPEKIAAYKKQLMMAADMADMARGPELAKLIGYRSAGAEAKDEKGLAPQAPAFDLIAKLIEFQGQKGKGFVTDEFIGKFDRFVHKYGQQKLFALLRSMNFKWEDTSKECAGAGAFLKLEAMISMNSISGMTKAQKEARVSELVSGGMTKKAALKQVGEEAKNAKLKPVRTLNQNGVELAEDQTQFLLELFEDIFNQDSIIETLTDDAFCKDLIPELDDEGNPKTETVLVPATEIKGEKSEPVMETVEVDGQQVTRQKMELKTRVIMKENKSSNKFGPEKVKEIIRKQIELSLLTDGSGAPVDPTELDFFSSPCGQLVLFWLSNATDLVMANETVTMTEVNDGKKELKKLMDPKKAAAKFAKDLAAQDVGVLMTQECSETFLKALTRKATIFERIFGTYKRFVPAAAKGTGATSEPQTNIFLRPDMWESWQTVEHRHFDTDKTKNYKFGLVLAFAKKTLDPFLFASIHGDAGTGKSMDAREKIVEAVEQFLYYRENGYPDLELILGMDSNSKTDEDNLLLNEILSGYGLFATDCGVTNSKTRGHTAQMEKGGKVVKTPGDGFVTSPMRHYRVSKTYLGGKHERIAKDLDLPNRVYSSDHLPVRIVVDNVWTVWSAVKYYIGISAHKHPADFSKIALLKNVRPRNYAAERAAEDEANKAEKAVALYNASVQKGHEASQVSPATEDSKKDVKVANKKAEEALKAAKEAANKAVAEAVKAAENRGYADKANLAAKRAVDAVKTLEQNFVPTVKPQEGKEEKKRAQ